MKQRVMALIFVCIIIFSSIGLSGGSAVSHAVTLQGFAGGTGTSENPWQIATAAQLNEVRYFLGSTNSDKHFILIDNIDLGVSPYNEGEGWVPIGDYASPFTGNFDGNGKTITGLYINISGKYDYGLFGNVVGGHIQNVGLTNVNINAYQFSGGLAGYYDGTIANVFVAGSISGQGNVGGLVGQLSSAMGYSSNVENAWAAVNVTGISNLGGLVGSTYLATITNSYYNIEVAGQTDTGKGEPRSTAEMTFPYNAETTYVGWDFVNIWDIQDGVNSGYPFIRQQIEPNAEFAGGNGSEADPYQITTIEHLNNVRNYLGVTHTDKHFLLMNNIDLTSYVSSGGEGYDDGQGWQPIGYSTSANIYNYSNCFFGSFDGGEHTISGLIINRQPTVYENYEQCGLFGALVDADVSNLNLGVQVMGTRFAAGLAGFTDQSIIDNIQIVGDVTGNESYIGGLIGFADGTMITNSSMTGTVSSPAGSLHTGGLLGDGTTVTIINCNTDATVSGNYSVGGLAGSITSGSSIAESFATGSVTGLITGNDLDTFTGGMVGFISSSSISLCYSTGDVSGSQSVGGLCGVSSDGEVSDSYASGDVTGIDSVGGLIGENSYSNITNTFAVGVVNSSGTKVGGLVGENYTFSIFNCFYDSDTTGQWSDNLSIGIKGTPKTTEEMMQQATFTGWDFTNIWGIVENVTYPYLLTEPVTPATYTVNFSVTGGNGTLGATVDSLGIITGAEVVEGKDVIFTATPDSGYRVKEWTLDSAVVSDNTSNSYTVGSLAADIAVTVEFELVPPTTYTVNFSVTGGNGTLGAAVDSLAITTGAEVVEGKDVVFTATPDSGYRVKEWTLDSAVVSDNTSNSYTVGSLAAHIAVTVEFELVPPTTYTVNFSVTGGNGTLGAAVDSLAITTGAEVVEGKDVVFAATPDSGYRVKEWTLDSAVVSDNTSNSYTVGSLAADIAVTVEFELIPPLSGYIVSVSSNPSEGGTVTGGGNYETGDRVKVSATANENYVFIHWTEGSTVVCKGATYNFKMGTENRNLVAHFEATVPATSWLVTTSARPSEGGSVSGGGLYEEGDLVEVIAIANSGYRFINWTEGLIEVSTDAVYSFTMGTTVRSLTANFLTEGTGWPKEIKLSATDITNTSVTLRLSQAVPDAEFYLVYVGDVLYETFDATSFAAMKLEKLEPVTFYTFTVQALYPDGIETSDGPSLKVKTKK